MSSTPCAFLASLLVFCSTASAGGIGNVHDLRARLRDLGRSGRTVYAWSTSAGNWNEKGWQTPDCGNLTEDWES